ncbi:MAG: hypothetical protein ACFE0Q_01950 [Anaerolineae bacterium]
MAENQLKRQLAAGIRAAQQGDRTRARELLEGILRQDRNNEQAWIWLASVVDSQRERRLSLERVLKINPSNTAAQEALNSMVGVLGAGESTIDYDAISAAAATPSPIATGSTRNTSTQQASGGNRLPLLIGVGVILGLLLLGSFIIPPLLQLDETHESTVVAEVTEEQATVDPLFTPPSPTTAPTATFDGSVSLENITRNAPSAPTFTPTVSPTPTDTPTATPTLPPLTEYNFLLLGVQGSASSSIYRVNGDGTELRNILVDVDDFDYNPQTGLLVYTQRVFVDVPTSEPTATFTPAPTNTPLPNNVIPGVNPTSRPGGLTLDLSGASTDLLQFKMYTTNIDNLDETLEVTNANIASAFAPAISPDGNYIAFVTDIDGDRDLYLYDVSTRLSERITDNTGIVDTDPSWSPDGSLLVFSSDRTSASNNDLFTIDPFADNPNDTITPVLQSRGQNVNPDWSSVDDEIVYLNLTNDDTSIRLTSLDGTRTSNITTRPDWRYTAPIWTADGNYIVYSASESEDQPLGIRVYNPTTRQTQPIRTVNLNVLQVIER